MFLHFSLHYRCESDEQLAAVINDTKWIMSRLEDGYWELDFELMGKLPDTIQYSYALCDLDENTIKKEWGQARYCTLESNKSSHIHLIDEWREGSITQRVYSSLAFKSALNPWKDFPSKKRKLNRNFHLFRVAAPRVNGDYVICLTGSDTALGNWEETQAIQLQAGDFPFWEVAIKLQENARDLAYKFALYDPKEKRIISWEEGDNRKLTAGKTHYPKRQSQKYIISHEAFRNPIREWKGAGVALPLSAIRSKGSTGIGDFEDLKKLIDWAAQSGLHAVQLLPINDSIAKHDYSDANPYTPISAFALHPVYASMEALGELSDKKLQKEINAETRKLEAFAELQYPKVIALKMRFFRALFAQEGKKVLKRKAFRDFFEENKEWLEPYAAFCVLRDKFQTIDYSKWKNFQKFNIYNIRNLSQTRSPDKKEIELYYFIQYHLDAQLQSAADYAREKKVVLKGDLPISLRMQSVDTWVHPQLFKLDKQVGAPPDDFSEDGQAWAMPPYDWTQMAEENYAWWQRRLKQMQKFFTAYRIDHILGFFRMWEIPNKNISALMGTFVPAKSFTQAALKDELGWFDEERFCKPFSMKNLDTDHQHTDPANILFIKSAEDAYHPRILLQKTVSFQQLDESTQRELERLYFDYFYNKNEELWQAEALKRLSGLLATNEMLPCGEDLGMLPACVPEVMQQLGILSLEIQRMPKHAGQKFGNLNDLPWLSVCSPGTHDMPPIRAWWTADRAKTQHYFERIMGHYGRAPQACPEDIVRNIVMLHLNTASMWAIIPIQDLLAMDKRLAAPDPYAERINIPGQPEDNWKYRIHLDIEELIDNQAFSHLLATLIQVSGRDEAF